MGEIKEKAVSGFFWTAIEKFGSRLVQFALGVILARLLMPSDYGLIGMLTIFLSISGVILDSGFSSALIQKKDRDDFDYSTVFFVNIALGVFLYILCYLLSPYIASFYDAPQLENISKVLFITLIISSFTGVPRTKLRAELKFKTLSKITVSTAFFSALAGLYMAYNGYGVWALVGQALCQALLSMVFTWIASRWKPLMCFSILSFKRLFGFGYKLMFSSLINHISNDIYGLVIGKYASSGDLGLYNRALHFAEMPAVTGTQILNNVNYPLLVKYQDDKEQLLGVYTKLLRTPLFIIFPILAIMGAVAQPMITVLLGDKWLQCTWLITILCCGFMWYPLSNINLNLLYVLGRSDLVLKLEFVKKPIMIILLVCTIPFGILGVSIGRAIYSIFAFCMNCYYTKRLLNYGLLPQLREVLPIFLYSAVAAVCAYTVVYLLQNPIQQLVFGTLAGCGAYLGLAYIFHDKAIIEVRSLFQRKLCKYVAEE